MSRDGLPPGTVIVASSHSSCNACGRSCNPDELSHTTRPSGKGGGKGCGIAFTHITTPSSVEHSRHRTRLMRPDLIFVEFPSML